MKDKEGVEVKKWADSEQEHFGNRLCVKVT